MNTEKQLHNSVIQLDNGSNYEVIEKLNVIKMLMDDIIDDNTFIPLHFTDGLECMVKKSKIAIFYENTE